MKLHETGARLSDWADPQSPPPARPIDLVLDFADKTCVIAGVEVGKLRHDPTDLLTRAIQPALWLLLFGQVFSRTHTVPTGHLGYADFITPGILAQSVLFIAIFYGIAIIWERDLGIVQKLLTTPTPRGALVLGKALSAGIRGLSQAIIVYALALLLGVRVNWSPAALLGVLVAVLLGSSLFSTFSLIIASVVKTRERFMGIGQVLTMPLFFASNAIYPIEIMPRWLKTISQLNPLTYEVDALRALMLAEGTSAYGLGMDFGVLLAATAVLVVVGARMYPNLVR